MLIFALFSSQATTKCSSSPLEPRASASERPRPRVTTSVGLTSVNKKLHGVLYHDKLLWMPCMSSHQEPAWRILPERPLGHWVFQSGTHRRHRALLPTRGRRRQRPRNHRWPRSHHWTTCCWGNISRKRFNFNTMIRVRVFIYEYLNKPEWSETIYLTDEPKVVYQTFTLKPHLLQLPRLLSNTHCNDLWVDVIIWKDSYLHIL